MSEQNEKDNKIRDIYEIIIKRLFKIDKEIQILQAERKAIYELYDDINLFLDKEKKAIDCSKGCKNCENKGYCDYEGAADE